MEEKVRIKNWVWFFLLIAFNLIYGCRVEWEKGYIFFPEKEIVFTPHDVGLLYEDIYFKTEDGLRLNGWFVKGREDITFLWFHGNAGNLSHRVDRLKLFHERLKINIFVFDYREYGKSEGSVSEEGTYMDGVAALRYLRSRGDIDPDKIILFGRSLGAAVAVETAIKEGCYAMILESPFTSVRDMGRELYPLLPVWMAFKTRYDSISKINKIRCPILVVHGDSDEIVPFGHGKRLYDTAIGPKEFYTIKGAHHNDTYIIGGEPYLSAISRFIRNLGKD